MVILISGHGLGCVQTMRSSVLLTPLSMFWLLMKNTLDKDHQMTDTLTPFQIFFSLSVMNNIYPLSFFRRLCNIKAGGKKKMCISNLYIMKPLNLRLRLWDRSCEVTSHFEVQYNKYKLECLHVFFSLSLVTRGGGVSDRVHWNKHTPRFLDIAIKHCVIHLLELTIILEQIILFHFF